MPIKTGVSAPGTIVPVGALLVPGGIQGVQGIPGTQGVNGAPGPPGLSGAQEVGSVKAWPSVVPPATWMKMDGSVISRALYPDLFNLIGTTFGAGDGSTTFNLPDARSNFIIGAGQSPGLSNYTLGAGGGEENHVLVTAELASHLHYCAGVDHLHSLQGHTHNMDHYHLVPAGQFNHAHTVNGSLIQYAGQAPPSGNNAYQCSGATGIQATVANTLPQANTNYASQTNGAWVNTGGPSVGTSAAADRSLAFNSNSAGGDTGHNNMPPFLVLVYIIKVSAGGGPTAQAPIADNTQPGLMNQLSGNQTDYVGGDNQCHPIVGPALVFLTAARQLTLNDNNKYFVCTGSWTLSIPAPTAGVSYRVRNDNGIFGGATPGTITITPPSGTIDGLASLPLLTRQEVTLLSDGSTWRTFGLQRDVTLGSYDIPSPISSLVIPLPGGYNFFDFQFAKLTASTATANMQCQVSTDGGNTWLTSTSAYYGMYYYNNAATTLATAFYNTTGYWYWGIWIESSAPRYYGKVKFYPGDAVGFPSFEAEIGAMWNVTWVGRFDMSGFYNAAGRINAIRLTPNTGTLNTMSMVVKGAY